MNSQFQFKTTYEYQGKLSADSIVQTVTRNFLFPSWTCRYPTSSHDPNQIYYLNMIDVRSFKQATSQNNKKDIHSKKHRLEFVYEDQLEIQKIKEIEKYRKDNFDNNPEVQNYLQEASNLLKNWELFLNAISAPQQPQNIVHGMIINESNLPIEYIVYPRQDQFLEEGMRDVFKGYSENQYFVPMKEVKINRKHVHSHFVRVDPGYYSTRGLQNIPENQYALTIRAVREQEQLVSYQKVDILIKNKQMIRWKITGEGNHIQKVGRLGVEEYQNKIGQKGIYHQRSQFQSTDVVFEQFFKNKRKTDLTKLKIIKVFYFQRIKKCLTTKIDALCGEYFLIRSSGVHHGEDSYSSSNLVFAIEDLQWPIIGRDARHLRSFHLEFDLIFKRNLQLNFEAKEKYFNMPENVNVKSLEILINIKDEMGFLENELKAEEIEHNLSCFQERYFWIQNLINRNRVVLPFQECKFKRNVYCLNQHFHLAFQGGGAKGLAYVGAYRSINQKKMTQQPGLDFISPKTKIPISSIMGSSAGGMIALAISTRIPEYELQKICYQMNDIPLTDRFSEQESEDVKFKAKDDYGNVLEKNNIKDIILTLLEEYGVFQKDVAKSIIEKLVKLDDFALIQDKLLEFVELTAPAMAQILTIYTKPTPNVQNNNDQQSKLWNKIKNWLVGEKKPLTEKLKKVNWQGLLMHGALMKGEAIHNIAVDCIVKFLIMKTSENDQEEFRGYLKDCLEPNEIMVPGRIDLNFADSTLKSTRITGYLKKHFELSLEMLNIKLSDIIKQITETGALKQGQQFFMNFYFSLINRFIILVDNYLKLRNDKQGLLLYKQGRSQINHDDLTSKKDINSLLDYFLFAFKKNHNKQNDKIIEEENIESEDQKLMLSQQLTQVYRLKQKKIMKQKKEALSYSELNSILDCHNLINPEDFYGEDGSEVINNIKIRNYSIIQTMKMFFKTQLDNIDFETVLEKQIQLQKKDKGFNIDQLFYALEGAEAVVNVANLLKKNNKLSQPLQDISLFQVVQRYENNLNKLRKEVETVTMAEYYRLNRVEISCTSVDLENKILRFFNHKTTPQLPICRAVQMTGSFPVGFKAQKWKSQWGKYLVYLLQQKMEIDITGHEFTDGGLLANFPIKYMDNQNIRKRYFCHKKIVGTTILLGFGLDYLDSQKYEQTQNQVDEEKELVRKRNIVWSQLVDLTGRLKNKIFNAFSSFPLFWSTRHEKWAQIGHYLKRDVPLLNFGFKIIEAYPNADRNLNLQAFENRVLNQELDLPWRMHDTYRLNNIAEGKAFIKQFFHQYTTQLSKDLFKPEEHEENYDIEKNIQDQNQAFNQRQQQVKRRITLIKKQFLSMVKTSGLYLMYDQSDQNLTERHLSLRLIKIFYLHLKLPQNQKIASRLSRIFAFYKYIAGDYKYQHRQRGTNNLSQDRDITPDLNRINFLNLYNAEKYEEISHHLAFKDYHKHYWEDFVQILKKSKTNVQSQDNSFEKDKLYNKFRNQKRKKDLKHLSSFDSQQFFDMSDFDVTDSLKSLTQLLYLMIKIEKFKPSEDRYSFQIRKLSKTVKTKNFEELLYDENINDFNDVQFLRYDQIVAFLKLEVGNLVRQDLQITEDFDKFLEQRTQQDPSKLYKIYFTHFMRFGSSRLPSPNEQQANISKYLSYQWYLGEYKYMRNFQLKRETVEIIRKMIKKDLHDSQEGQSVTSKVLYEILFIGNQVKDKQLLEGEDESLHYHQIEDIGCFECLLQKQNNTLRKLDKFLHFAIDDDLNQRSNLKEIQEQIPAEKIQKIQRKKERCFEWIMFLLRKYFLQKKHTKYSHNCESINFIDRITSKGDFINRLQEKEEQELNDRTLNEEVKAAMDQWIQKYSQIFKKCYADISSKVQNSMILFLKEISHELQKLYKNQEEAEKLIREESGKQIIKNNQIIKKYITQHQVEDPMQILQKRLKKYMKKWMVCCQKEVFDWYDNGQTNVNLLIDKIQNWLKLSIIILDKNNYLIKISRIEDNHLKIIQLNIIKSYIQSQLNNQNTVLNQEKDKHKKELNQKCLQLHKQYSKDMELIFHSLKESLFLVSSLQKHKVLGQKDHEYLAILKDNKILSQLIEVYRDIFESFVSRYYLLAEKAVNQIDQVSLGDCFLIDFKHINKLAHLLYSTTREIYHSFSFKLTRDKTQIQLTITSLYNIFRKIISHKFAIPLLDIDWNLSVQSTNSVYIDNVIKILLFQKIRKRSNFKHKTIKGNEKLGKIIKQNKPNKQLQFDQRVHLILEGVHNSNEYYTGLYNNIDEIFQNSKTRLKMKDLKSSCNQISQLFYSYQNLNKKTQEDTIRMITCSNFHSVFAFLLSMGYSTQFIRRELFKLKFIANRSESKELKKMSFIKNFVDSKPFVKQLSKHLDTQFETLFKKMNKMNDKSIKNTSLAKDFQEVREIYVHEKEQILKIHLDILEETTKSITKIDKNYSQEMKPLQIAKKFGFNYKSKFKTHKYESKSKISSILFILLTESILHLFGSILTGIVCNNLAQSNVFEITEKNADDVIDGFLAHELFTVFQLKNYIMKRLSQRKLNPDISLSEFYQLSKRKIFINYTVIDVNRERITFLNSNTVPNMPLWAAILAASSVPFLHKFFEANKEWQATKPQDFRQFFLYEYFKADSDQNTRVNRYTSANLVSSLPLELLTNQTIRTKIYALKEKSIEKHKRGQKSLEHKNCEDQHKFNSKDKHFQSLDELKQFTICFSSDNFQNQKIVNLTITKKFAGQNLLYGMLGGLMFVKLVKQAFSKLFLTPLQWTYKKIRGESVTNNNKYEINYPVMSNFTSWLGSGSVMKTFSILANSNDNFILKWYYDKLIRLPIKIDTLEFNEIIDKNILKKYNVSVLSQKAEETVERSYEITKYFIAQVNNSETNLIDCTDVLNVQEQGVMQEDTIRQFNVNQIIQNLLEEHSSLQRLPSLQFRKTITGIEVIAFNLLLNKFRLKLRVKLIEKINKTTGFKRLFFKLSFLNHSKWNHNNYNNFIIEYYVNEDSELYKSHNKTYKKVNQSEIIWSVESNTKIWLKFYYLVDISRQREKFMASKKKKSLESQESNEQKMSVQSSSRRQIQEELYFNETIRQDIRQTEFVLDFKQLVEKLPVRDSYDYEFVFGWPEDEGKLMQNHLKPNQFVSFSPIKINQLSFTQKLVGRQHPKLLVEFVQLQGQEDMNSQIISRSHIPTNNP